MSESNEEQLSDYIRRVMKEKGLTQHDVEARSGDQITERYVADILRGASKNPSVEKLIALAHGIGIDPDELFAIARRAFEKRTSKSCSTEPLDADLFLEILQMIDESPELMEIVQAAIQLSPAEQRRLNKLLHSLFERTNAVSPVERLDQTLLEAGVISEIPPRITDPTAYEDWEPVEVTGKPLSEIIIEDRR